MWKMTVIAVSFLFGKKVHDFRYVPEFLRRVDWKKTRHEPRVKTCRCNEWKWKDIMINKKH